MLLRPLDFTSKGVDGIFPAGGPISSCDLFRWPTPFSGPANGIKGCLILHARIFVLVFVALSWSALRTCFVQTFLTPGGSHPPLSRVWGSGSGSFLISIFAGTVHHFALIRECHFSFLPILLTITVDHRRCDVNGRSRLSSLWADMHLETSI
jgi:hypothetical protein